MNWKTGFFVAIGVALPAVALLGLIIINQAISLGYAKERYNRVIEDHVYALVDTYVMNP